MIDRSHRRSRTPARETRVKRIAARVFSGSTARRDARIDARSRRDREAVQVYRFVFFDDRREVFVVAGSPWQATCAVLRHVHRAAEQLDLNSFCREGLFP